MLPSGVILLWSGLPGAIPAGYVLCDGNNGTPDLRNRFIVGAGDTYSVDDTGGNILHKHFFTGDGHTHDLTAGGDILSGAGLDDTTASAQAVGDTDDTNGLPPYHALCYIMKT